MAESFPVFVSPFFFFSFCPYVPLLSHLHSKAKTEEQRRATSKTFLKAPAGFFFFPLLLVPSIEMKVTFEIRSNSSLWCSLVFLVFSFHICFCSHKQRPPLTILSPNFPSPQHPHLICLSFFTFDNPHLCLSVSLFLSPRKNFCPLPVKISRFRREFRGQPHY